MTKNNDNTGPTGGGDGSGNDHGDDPAELARRFVDLWQSQISAMGSDPDLTRSMEESVRAWQNFTSSLMAGQGPNASPMDGVMQAMAAWGQHDAGAQHQKSDRPKTAAGASDGGERILHELDRRLARIEERLARLESRPSGGSGKTDGGVGKSASRKTAAKKAATKKTAAKRPRKKPATKS
ncbi:hypothetical protein [Pacificispira spongiicola]|uniref:hypothetical protein n=1 Tax=Pacificispira spongiicola TaxID=2729598 RepID=UPI001D0C5703|nr:hypothetical protein [Pacificispira spongiicola]